MVSGTLIVVGALDPEQAKSVEYYNPDVDEWNKILTLNIDRVRFRSIMLEGKLLFIGGMRSGTVTADVQSYDFHSGTMTTLPPFRIPRSGHGVAILARHLYVVGGFNNRVLNSVERYNPLTGAWTDLLPIPTARSTPGVVVHNEEIYVIGGSDYIKTVAIVESFNPITESWKERAQMNEMRDDPAVTSIGNFLYVISGGNGTALLSTAERYDPVVDRWTFIHSISVPRRRCNGCYFNNSLIIAGGENDTEQPSSAVDSYDIKENVWESKSPLATPRTFFSLVEVPWKYIIRTLELQKLKDLRN